MTAVDKRMAYSYALEMPRKKDWLTAPSEPMFRTTIWLSKSQKDKLAVLSKKSGVAVAELIRRCVDAGLEKA